MNSKTDNNILLIVVLVLSVALFGAWHWKTDAIEPKIDQNNDRWSQPGWDSSNNEKEELPSITNDEDLVGQYKNYQEAVATAKSQNKKMFIFFHEDWCSWCEKMQKETLSDSKVKAALEKYVIYIANKSDESAVAKKYNVRGIPAYYIANSMEKIEKKGIGYKDVDSFLKWLKGQNNNRRSRRKTSVNPQFADDNTIITWRFSSFPQTIENLSR